MVIGEVRFLSTLLVTSQYADNLLPLAVTEKPLNFPTKIFMHKRTIEWASGIFEGEGCMTKIKSTGRWHVQLEMSDKDIVEDWHRIMGLDTKITERPARYGRKTKPTYMLQTRKKSEVRRIVADMLPYFGERRAYIALNLLDDLECS